MKGSSLQDELRALLTPDAYPHVTGPIELVQTHVSWVLLTGPFAYKIKRPVHHPFIDLRSPERRAFFCHEELRLNQRFAAELYVDVCEVRSHKGEARIGGPGIVIDHAVRMKQFPREDELARLLASGRIEAQELGEFGRNLAEAHARLPVVPQGEPWGSPGTVRAVILENLEQCQQAGRAFGAQAELQALGARLSAVLESRAARIADRLAGGRVRECHGDLHSGNIVRREGRLVAFDCMEFAPAFRWIDIAEEIAFLLADLETLRHPAHAHAFLGGYLTWSGDYEACRLLNLYKAHRALVRAKVTALGGTEQAVAGDEDLGAARGKYDAFVQTARAALAPKLPLLVLMGGLSGSGKTWLASRLAPLVGAIHVRSDVERKRLAGIAEFARSMSPVEQGLYAPEATERVYAHLLTCAEHALDGSCPVIVDAAFSRREHRARFRELAGRLGVDVRLLHCRAEPEVLRRRVTERHGRGSDASEANLEVLRWQESGAEAIESREGLAVVELDTSGAEPRPSIAELARLLHAPVGVE